MTRNTTLRAWVTGLVGFVLCSSQVHAGETQIGFQGIGVQLGAVSPDKTSTAFTYGGTLDLGSLYKQWLDFGVGVTYWKADRDGTSGDISDLRLHGDVRWHPFRISGVSPYALAALSLHNVGADIPASPSLEAALDGFSPGIDVGFGLASTKGALGLGVEFRQQFVDDIGNWGILARVGWKKRTEEAAR